TDPRLSKRKDDDGRYPIHWATSSNNHEIVLLLANQASFDPDIQDDSGWTPLMIAASVPSSEPVLNLLLQRGADVNVKNQTALHFVASKKNLDVARLLMDSKPPASTRVRDRRGQYPIHRAAAVGSVPMVTLLLKNKSPLNAADNEGYTPLHHAIAEGHGDTAVALLKEEADFTLKTNQGELAIDLAPDKEVRQFIIQGAEREGIQLVD
ncbi:ankyrin repeat domain containing protein, partial [Trichoderma cornu-damae]